MYGVKFCLLQSTAKLNSPPTESQVHSNGVKMFGLVFLFKNFKGLLGFFGCLLGFFSLTVDQTCLIFSGYIVLSTLMEKVLLDDLKIP